MCTRTLPGRNRGHRICKPIGSPFFWSESTKPSCKIRISRQNISRYSTKYPFIPRLHRKSSSLIVSETRAALNWAEFLEGRSPENQECPRDLPIFVCGLRALFHPSEPARAGGRQIEKYFRSTVLFSLSWASLGTAALDCEPELQSSPHSLY